MVLLHSMKHRHLDTQEYTVAAIDDIISRGQRKDWLELRNAVKSDEQVAMHVKAVCDHYAPDESVRYDFWPVYLRYVGYGYLYEQKTG